MNIGKEIRRRRQALNWTLEYLANLVESDTGNLSRIENGKQGASADMLSRIATALSCTPADLFSDGDREGGIPAGARRVPFLEISQVKAGMSAVTSGEKNQQCLFTELELPPQAFALRLQDESMLPGFGVGDAVIVDPLHSPAPGSFVVAVVSGEVLVRRYKAVEIDEAGKSVFELVPLNEDYPSLRSDRSAIRIAGSVIEHRRYWKRKLA